MARSKSKTKVLSIATVGILVLALAIGGMLAYFTDTDTATNEFTIGDNVNIALTEVWDEEDGEDLHPGAVVEKAPSIENESTTTPAYVFATVTVPCYASTESTVDTPLFTYEVNNGWTLLNTPTVDTTAKTITYVYAYGTASAMTTLAASSTTSTAIFDEVTLAPTLTSEQAATASVTPNIVINAYGIQVDNLGTTSPYDIFNLFGTSIHVTKPLEIGDAVNYSTTLNGVTLDDWHVFYVDGDYTYIIYDDYLPNAAISSTIKTTHGLSTSGTYGVYADGSRADLINAMTTKANWNSLLTGTLNGTIAVNETPSANVWAMGAPDIELWVDSWNESYPSDTLYIAQTATAQSDGLSGYYLDLAANPDTNNKIFVSLSSKTGYNNTLYFPHQEDISDCEGYWLASPSAGGGVLSVRYSGYVIGDDYDYYAVAFRPVVCLPSNILNQ